MISSKEIRKKRILIIGSKGMLGQKLTKYYKNNEKIVLLCSSIEKDSFLDDVDYMQADISIKSDVKRIVTDFYPDAIINAAAYSNVDKCELEKDIAWSINVVGVENLAYYSQISDSHLVHISTDYIFDGENGPYNEKDKPAPIGYYGRTKLASENAVTSRNIKYSILRTNVLYGYVEHGKPDFVRWTVDSLQSNKHIKIVTDQINNPTYLDDLVQGINKVIEFNKTGIFNIAGSEYLSRYDFVLRIADFFKLDKHLISPILTSDLNQPARRPLKSGLIILKAETELGYKPHTIEDTLLLMKKAMNL